MSTRLDIFSMPTLEQASMARDIAILQQAASNGPEFGERARAHILECLMQGPMSGEELVISCKNAGVVPIKGDDRAYGGAFMSLSKKGLIVKAGSCKRLRGHGTGGGVIWSLATERPILPPQ